MFLSLDCLSTIQCMTFAKRSPTEANILTAKQIRNATKLAFKIAKQDYVVNKLIGRT